MNFRLFCKTFISGFLGGTADVVPGISGGTVYYLLGVYDELMRSLSALPSVVVQSIKNRSLSHIIASSELKFLFTLGFGVATAFFLLTSTIVSLLNSEQYRSLLFALFFGLVLGSAFIVIRPIIQIAFEHISTRKKSTVLVLFIVGSISGLFFDTLLQPYQKKGGESLYSVRLQFPTTEVSRQAAPIPQYTKNGENYNAYLKEIRGVSIDELEILVSRGYVNRAQDCMRQKDGKIEPVGQLLAAKKSSIFSFFHLSYFMAGLIACIAMLLPGISGSYTLHMIGMYGPILAHLLTVIDGIKGMNGVYVDLYAFSVILQVGLGVICGGFLFSMCIESFIKRWPRETHALLTGVLLGSIGVLWPFQHLSRIVNPFSMDRGYELQTRGFYCPSFTTFLSSQEWFIMLGSFLFVILLESIKQIKQKKVQLQYP